jgi:FMN phosphatase YigB (HAD superfamily)
MNNAIIFDWIGTLYERNVGLYPSSEKVLRELKPHYKLGLVSMGKDPEERKVDVAKSGIADLFDSIIISNAKTHEQYLECIAKLGSIPENTCIVDDRTIRGIMFGNQLGCKTYWIYAGEYGSEFPNKETGEPTYRIRSVEDLLMVLHIPSKHF